MKKNKKDIPKEFWTKYVDGDTLNRHKLVSVFVKQLDEIRVLKEDKYRKLAIENMLCGLFDDLIEYCYEDKR